MIKSQDIVAIKSESEFKQAALEVFHFQAEHCAPYKQYIELLGIDHHAVESVEQIPFLPIELFKTHDIYCGNHAPEKIYTMTGEKLMNEGLTISLPDGEKAIILMFNAK